MRDDWDETFEDEPYEEGDDFDDTVGAPLDARESALIRQDLQDLERFHATFAREGYRGVSVYCQDCGEEHYYPWEMLRENLRTLLETGETPVHEPAFSPNPEEYIPWEYARGYVDALADLGVDRRVDADQCPRCRYKLPGEVAQANFCPRCGTTLLAERLRAVLEELGFGPEEVRTVLQKVGLPTRDA